MLVAHVGARLMVLKSWTAICAGLPWQHFTDGEPDFETVTADCRVIGFDVRAL